MEECALLWSEAYVSFIIFSFLAKHCNYYQVQFNYHTTLFHDNKCIVNKLQSTHKDIYMFNKHNNIYEHELIQLLPYYIPPPLKIEHVYIPQDGKKGKNYIFLPAHLKKLVDHITTQ